MIWFGFPHHREGERCGGVEGGGGRGEGEDVLLLTVNGELQSVRRQITFFGGRTLDAYEKKTKIAGRVDGNHLQISQSQARTKIKTKGVPWMKYCKDLALPCTLYLVHPGVGEEEGRVVDGHHRGRRVRRVFPLGLKVVRESLPNLYLQWKVVSVSQ